MPTIQELYEAKKIKFREVRDIPPRLDFDCHDRMLR